MQGIYYAVTKDSKTLIHHGVKGMHWGIRRYQNADGTLTAAGRRRANKKARIEVKRQRKEDHRNRSILSDGDLDAKITRLQKEKRLSELTKGEKTAVQKAIKTAVGLTATAVAVGAAAYIMKSRTMKMAYKSVANKTISSGKRLVNSKLAYYRYKPDQMNKYMRWSKIDDIGRVVAKDIRGFNPGSVANMIRLRK